MSKRRNPDPRQKLGKDNITEDLLFGLTFTDVAPTKRVSAVSYVLYFRGNDFEGVENS